MTPRKIIISSAVFSLFFCSLLLWLTFRTPWLGIEFTVKHSVSGLIIEDVHKDGPTYNILKPGMQIVELGNTHHSIPLGRAQFIREPADSASFAIYNQFVTNNQKIYNILSTERIWLKDKNGHIYHIKPQPYRSLTSLNMDHLAIIMVSILAFVFHVMVAVFRKNELAVKVLSITAISFSLHIMIGQTTFFRELVIHPLVFEYIHPLQMLTALFYAYFLVGVLCYYPSRLVSKRLIYLLFTLSILFWLNLITQSVELPDGSYLMQFNILYLIALSMAFFQWRKARGSAIKMAQFKWLFLAMNGGTILNIVLNILPQSLGKDPLVGISAVLLFSYIIFIGIAIGMYRYKLFNIDRWWFRVWSWFFAGLVVVLLDVLFVWLLNIEQQAATITSMLIVGWVYFPIRQRIWKNFSYSPGSTLSQYMPDIITSMAAIDNTADINKALLKTLQRIFQAQNAEYTNRQSIQPSLNNSGLSLQLPDIHNENTLILDYAENGARLFSHDDISLATGISELYKRLHDALDSKQQGVQQERERIMSDLHDELGPKLLTLIHKLNTPSLIELAKDSLSSLRDTVYSLQHEQAMPLSELFANERPLLTERAAEKNKNIVWHISDELEETYLKADEVLHIKRILNEMISNELRHGTSQAITISAKEIMHSISIKLCTVSANHNIDHWKKGVGLNSINRRSKALHGTIKWHSKQINNTDNICFELLFPNHKAAA